MQVSPARLKEPEAQHPGENGHRTTASISYANGRGLSATAAYSEKNRDPGATLSAWLAKVNWDRDDHHTLFGRVENVKNDELFSDHDDPLHDVPFRVIEFQGGYACRLPIIEPLNLALAGSIAAFDKPRALNAAYGKNPSGAMVFARLSIGH